MPPKSRRIVKMKQAIINAFSRKTDSKRKTVFKGVPTRTAVLPTSGIELFTRKLQLSKGGKRRQKNKTSKRK